MRVALVLAVLIVAGCSAPEPGPTHEVPESFTVQVQRAIDGAHKQGASEAQILLLEEASAQGEVTFEQTRQAAQAAVDCMTGAGLDAEYLEQTVKGLTLPGYAVTTGDDEAKFALMEGCDQREYGRVSELFQTQPTSQAVEDAFLEQYRAPLVACLEEAGYKVPDGGTFDDAQEVLVAAWQDKPGSKVCEDEFVSAMTGE